MSDLDGTLGLAGADHQLTRTESRQLVKEAGGNKAKLTTAIQHQGFSKAEADRYAGQIIAAAKAPSAAEPEALIFPVPAPLKPDKAVDFANSPTAKIDLLRSASQVNDVVGPIGNDVCGGAAVLSALILDSQDGDAASHNAEAIAKVAKSAGLPIGAAAGQALEHMKSGKMSPADTQHLQVLLYEIGQGISKNGTPGLDSGEMGALVGMLKARGALQHAQHVAFSLNTVTDATDSGNVVPHWTVDVDGTHVNTWANDKANRSALVEPSTYRGPGTAGWSGTVSLEANGDVGISYVNDRLDGNISTLHVSAQAAKAKADDVWTYLNKQTGKR